MKKQSRQVGKKHIILLGVNLVLLILFCVISFIANSRGQKFYSQYVAERWETQKGDYAQVSAFFSEGRRLEVNDLREIQSSVQKTLSDDSYYDREHSGRMFVDSYSGECETEVRKDANTLSITAVGVGNDFFRFHPMKLLSGSYIYGDDLNQDRVLLDENLAWALFGSNDIVGKNIWMGNSIYVVAGVVAVEDDPIYRIAYGNENRMYMMYETLKQQQENLYITCYEAVMPNPIENYAYNTLKTACGIQEDLSDEFENTDKNPLFFGDCEVIQNTKRFHGKNIMKKFSQAKYKSMRVNSVSYPFWENVARVENEWQTKAFICRWLIVTVPIISVFIFLCVLWKNRTWSIKQIFVFGFEKLREQFENQRLESESVMQDELEEANSSLQMENDLEKEEMLQQEEKKTENEIETLFQSNDWQDISGE